MKTGDVVRLKNPGVGHAGFYMLKEVGSHGVTIISLHTGEESRGGINSVEPSSVASFVLSFQKEREIEDYRAARLLAAISLRMARVEILLSQLQSGAVSESESRPDGDAPTFEPGEICSNCGRVLGKLFHIGGDNEKYCSELCQAQSECYEYKKLVDDIIESFAKNAGITGYDYSPTELVTDLVNQRDEWYEMAADLRRALSPFLALAQVVRRQPELGADHVFYGYENVELTFGDLERVKEAAALYQTVLAGGSQSDTSGAVDE